MGVNITAGGCLAKPMLKKLENQWTERSQAGRSALRHRAMLPHLWMFLPVWQAVHSGVYRRSAWRRASYRAALAGSECPGWKSSWGRSAWEAWVQECPKWGTGRWRAEETCATWQELLSRGAANNRSFGDKRRWTERSGTEKLQQFRQKHKKGQKNNLVKWGKVEDLGIWQMKPKTYWEGKKWLKEKKLLLYNNLVLKLLKQFLLKKSSRVYFHSR